MGRMLGAFDDNPDTERSDLNLCPDCGCYFTQDACPLCGKVCPEEMRAGNRKPVKKKKPKKRSGSSRVTFVAWYHVWWVILLALFFMPMIGVILLLTSPYSRSKKLCVFAAFVAYILVTSFGITRFFSFFEKPVDTSLSREDYVAACEITDAESFYRSAEQYDGAFVSINVTVIEKITESDGGKYNVYYICCSPENANVTLLIRDCAVDDPQNFLPGDVITVYGEGAGNREIVYDYVYVFSAPCINAAYIVDLP